MTMYDEKCHQDLLKGTSTPSRERAARTRAGGDPSSKLTTTLKGQNHKIIMFSFRFFSRLSITYLKKQNISLFNFTVQDRETFCLFLKQSYKFHEKTKNLLRRAKLNFVKFLRQDCVTSTNLPGRLSQVSPVIPYLAQVVLGLTSNTLPGIGCPRSVQYHPTWQVVKYFFFCVSKTLNCRVALRPNK